MFSLLCQESRHFCQSQTARKIGWRFSLFFFCARSFTVYKIVRPPLRWLSIFFFFSLRFLRTCVHNAYNTSISAGLHDSTSVILRYCYSTFSPLLAYSTLSIIEKFQLNYRRYATYPRYMYTVVSFATFSVKRKLLDVVWKNSEVHSRMFTQRRGNKRDMRPFKTARQQQRFLIGNRTYCTYVIWQKRLRVRRSA